MARFNKHLIHVSYAPCVPATLLYAIVHWLSFRRMSSYKKVILGKIHHLLSCLLNSLLVNVAIFFPPSLPPSLEALLLLSVVIQIKCGSPLVSGCRLILVATSPSFVFFALLQLRLALALLYANV